MSRHFEKTMALILMAAVMTFCLFAAIPGANAHEIWVNASEPEGQLVKADLGYSHAFPDPEPIAADRLHIFEPIALVTADGLIKLDQVGENFAYQKTMKLAKGSYLVLGTYKPTFWSNGPDGWAQKDRTQRPDADYVEEAVMCAKTIVNVKGAMDEVLISKPVGQRLEIVPLINPAKVNAGGHFSMRILCDGQPAKAVDVTATFAGFSDKGYMAFQGKTDTQGRIDFIPLKHGYWIVKASHAFEHPDKARADEVVLRSTLTFTING